MVYYECFRAESTTKVVDFMVRVTNPCASAVLTVDDTVLKPPPTLSMLQSVGYASKQLSWTDQGASSIFTSTVTGIACPAYTFELIDTDTSVAPISSLFTSDFNSDPKTLDVGTTDLILAKTYNLALKVYYFGL